MNRSLTELFHESQIYRIDHYLGKETVQNIMAFRFANTLFEPVWNRNYIDHVQITVAEAEGVGNRGHYYDQAGALRDMIQNHLLQILCLIAMEPPVSFSADEIRNKKVDVLHAIRPITPEMVQTCAVRGQYGAGWIESQHVEAYRTEPNVAPDSTIETFAAVKLLVDNWRWQGVPFYLRTGKRLPAKISEVSIQFRPVPHSPFPATAVMDARPNRLLIAIQPEEGLLLRFEAKYPGPTMRLSPVIMQFYYREAFKATPPEAYETLLLDVMLGDATLFMRADQTEAAWEILSPILDLWETVPAHRLSQLPGGHLGPGSRGKPPGPGRPQLGDAHLFAVPGRHGRLPGDHGADVIRVFDDPEALSRGAAEFLVGIAQDAVAARGRFSVALSGGSTPRRTYEMLAQPPFRDRLPWARTHIFWGDERCVDSGRSLEQRPDGPGGAARSGARPRRPGAPHGLPAHPAGGRPAL